MSHTIGSAHSAQSIQTIAQQTVGGAQGQFNGHTVAAAPAQPRATSALKTAWLEVQHFFEPLVGMRVSTPEPQQVNNADDATRAVMHAMTKREPDTLSVLGSLSQLLDHGHCTLDAGRDGMTQESGQMFRHEFQNMSDMQLLRLHTTFQKNPEFGEALTQSGSSAVMALTDLDKGRVDDLTVDEQRAGGRVNDLGFLALSLRGSVQSELEARGFKVETVNVSGSNPSPEMQRFAERVVENGGDTQTAISEIRAELALERHDAIVNTLEHLGVG
ncbi:hypothetical protein [Aureimonas jatrophae]|uniref:Uncharacterized protein n=1 Tax=Aureimonas jatrophae TaxID=1166073 RepID=A0A1H0CL19_9HYPH|nr:hypothetical protein [Aureimonas jatrophae]MBB3949281.1 hypothetical protein [Aureimonas jatrophae]SDN58564.1 hypothetical protein SAMN05192530_101357 [Aureimonas jatrophae]